MMRLNRLRLATSLAVVLAFAAPLAAASAAPLAASTLHPRLLRSAPAADSHLEAPPRQLALTFNESLDVALTRLALLHGDSPVRLDSLRLAEGDDRTVTAAISASLAPGRYTVRWNVTGDDGHPVRGTFSFEVLASDRVSTDGTQHRTRR